MKSIGSLADEVVLVAAVNKALSTLADRLDNEVGRLTQAERDMVADIVANGGSMPNNHWQPRRQAEMRLRTAMALRALFCEMFE